MAYILRRTDGRTVATIVDGGFDGDSNATIGSTSLTFVGKNYGPYAEMMAANFMKLLENFSLNTSPNHPLTGQVWYDRNVNALKVFTTYGVGNVWRTIGSSISSTTPTTLYPGDTWFNSTTGQLFVRRDTGVDVLIGPMAPISLANTEIRAETITDSVSAVHKTLGFYIDGKRVFILNADGTYYYNDPIAGNTTVNNGLTANTAISNNMFTGNVSNALLFNLHPTTDFFIRNIDQNTSGNLQIKNNAASASLIIGDTSKLLIHRDAGDNGVLENSLNSGWRLTNPLYDLLTVTSSNTAGFFNSSPVTTLDVNGSIKAKCVSLGSVSGTVNINSLLAGTYELSLSGTATLNIQNFTTAGQSLKVVISNTVETLNWTGATITWPNSVASPNFAAGPAKIVAINLFKTATGTIATYVTY